MLINLSNHSLDVWSADQMIRGIELFDSIQDLPFPIIEPKMTKKDVSILAKKYSTICKRLLSESTDKNNAVHIMGELTFVFSLILLLKKHRITCIASTTSRNSQQNGSKKTSLFRFAGFREY